MLDSRALPRPVPPREDHPFVQWFLMLALFTCGFSAWIFKPKFGGGDPLIPFSPLQVGLPLLGLGAAAFMLVATRQTFFRIMRPGAASFLLKAGAILVGGSAIFHFKGGDEGYEAALYIARWMLPLCFLLFMLPVRMAGVSPVSMFYGFIAGAVFSAVAVEAVRRGAPLPVIQSTEGRFGGFLNHPNQYGIVIATSSPLLVFFFFRRGFFAKLVSIFGLLVYFLCLFQSQSKTNIILFVAALGLSWLLLSLYDNRKFMIGLVLSAIGFVMLVLAGAAGLDYLKDISPKDAKTIEDAMQNPLQAKSVEDRQELWSDAIETIQDHPLFGVGPGQAMNYIPLPHAHNLFLQLWLDGGIPAVTGICLIVLSVFLRAFDGIREARSLPGPADDETRIHLLSGVAILIYVLGNSMSDSFNTATMSTFVLFAGLSYGYRPMVHPSEEEEPTVAVPEPFRA